MAVKRALLVVDVQRDFCEGGALAASKTPSLIIPLSDFIEAVRENGELIVFTQDWHPPDHSSFKQNGGQWPLHCVAGSIGAELMPPIALLPGDLLVHKGIERSTEGYSAFEATGLAAQLHARGIESVAVCGIATEYCVRATIVDALKAQFKASLLIDLIRAVDCKGVLAVFTELQRAGVELLDSHAWLLRDPQLR